MAKQLSRVSVTARRRFLLMGLTAVVWTCAIGGSFVRYRLAASSGISLELATTPRFVRLALGKEPYAAGAYVETPLKLVVPPGRTRIKISRDGYIAHVVSIEGEVGDLYKMDDVVLQKKDTTGYARLAIQAPTAERPLFVEVDDGFARGETPLIVDDVLASRPHSITVYPNWPVKEPQVRCFIASPLNFVPSELHLVKLKVKKSGKILFDGCVRDKARRS